MSEQVTENKMIIEDEKNKDYDFRQIDWTDTI